MFILKEASKINLKPLKSQLWQRTLQQKPQKDESSTHVSIQCSHAQEYPIFHLHRMSDDDHRSRRIPRYIQMSQLLRE